MKTYILILYLIFQLTKIQAQVVFCPPGAEWSYLFIVNLPWYEFSEKITYTGDTVIGGETVKRIVHKHFFPDLNSNLGNYQTFIKQNGDTVFMKNAWTSNHWQILYNFGATVGGGWANIFIEGTDSIYSYVTVDSMKYVTVNNMSLKRLYVSYGCYLADRLSNTPNAEITERFGCNKFMFNYCHRPASTDGDYFWDFLCYKDNGFGSTQFTSKPCNYSNLTSLDKVNSDQSIVRFYPNPSNGKLTLEISDSQSMELKIINSLGQLVYSENEIRNNQELDLSFLSKGIYTVKTQQGLTQTVSKLLIE